MPRFLGTAYFLGHGIGGVPHPISWHSVGGKFVVAQGFAGDEMGVPRNHGFFSCVPPKRAGRAVLPVGALCLI